MLRSPWRDESGAALIEYTVMLALLLAAAIVTIGSIGMMIEWRWDALEDALIRLR